MEESNLMELTLQQKEWICKTIDNWFISRDEITVEDINLLKIIIFHKSCNETSIEIPESKL